MIRRSIKGIGMTSQRTRDRLAARLHGKGINDTRVLEAIRHTPRHIFVDEALSSRAYEDTALPIGHGQTISQPYVVSRMTEALLAGGDLQKVLEIGTGSGYQAALLGQLVPAIYTVERIAALCELARERFHLLGLSNVRVKQADGNLGWPEHAPFDAIMVTAAPTEIPPALLEQLAEGARMVVPLGREHSVQQLSVVTRNSTTFTREVIDAVSFVPLVKPRG